MTREEWIKLNEQLSTEAGCNGIVDEVEADADFEDLSGRYHKDLEINDPLVISFARAKWDLPA